MTDILRCTLSVGGMAVFSLLFLLGLNRRLQKAMAEHARTENALRETEDKYRILIENIQDGVYIIQNGKITFVNDAFTRIAGCPANEIIGRDFLSFVAPGDRAFMEGCYKKRLSNEDFPSEYEFKLLHKNEKREVIASVNTGICSYRGEMISLGTIKDITARKRTEKALSESEKRYRTLQENIPVGLYRSTPDGKFLNVNAAMVKLFQYEAADELMAIPVIDLYVHSEQRKIIIDRLNGDGKLEGFETEFRRKNGTPFWASLCVSRVTDPNGHIFFDGIMRDITERKQAEEERLRREKLQSILELASAVCHEMGQPIQALYIYFDMLSDQVSGESSLDETVMRIGNEIDKMATITNNIRKITRHETKRYGNSGRIIDIDKSSDPANV